MSLNCQNTQEQSPGRRKSERKSAQQLKSLKHFKSKTFNRAIDEFHPAVGVILQMQDNSLVLLQYDIRKGIWLSPQRLPLPKLQRYELIPHIACIADCQVYIVGGRASGNCLNSVYVYNTSKKSISPARNMLTPRAGHGLAELNSSMFAVGGFNTYGYLHCVERYDPEDDLWVNVAPMTEAKVGMSVTGLNDRLYCVGGWNGERSLSTAECYDPATNQWSQLACLPCPRYGAGIAAVDGELYVLGGREETEKWITKDAMLTYDPNYNTWCTSNAPCCPDEYFMVVWQQQIWLVSFKGKQLLSYDSIRDQMIRPEQASYMRDCWGPLGVVMINKNL